MMRNVLRPGDLHSCHLTARFLSSQSPARIMVSANGVSGETGKPADISSEKCNPPKLR